MKPVDQTTFGHPGGNCFSACVASLLELPIVEVPYFMTGDDWFVGFLEWLKPRGFYSFSLKASPEDRKLFLGFYILGGASPRGPHAVIACAGETVHDPHPSRDGLVKIEDATFLIPFEPHVALAPATLDDRSFHEWVSRRMGLR